MGALAGCCHLPELSTELCSAPGAPPSAGQLLIDIHAHVYNGGDLQIAKFFELAGDALDHNLALLAKELGAILQLLTWTLSPSADCEFALLKDLKCNRIPAMNHVSALREGAYNVARAELLKAVERFDAAKISSEQAPYFKFSPRARKEINALAKLDYRMYENGRSARITSKSMLPLQKTMTTLIDFVVQHFNFRFVNAIDYFDKYQESSKEAPDLIVTSLLDLDWPLAKGRATPSSIPKQIEVMERISVLTGGRVHSFAPFCPMREVITRDPKGGEGESLTWVKDAVRNRGFIGVKLYPPMGFAIYGNEELEAKYPDFWHKRWLPKRAWQGGFGHELDKALRNLYGWCIEENVPVMAHTSPSCYTDPAFRLLGGAEYWQKAFDKCHGLRANFGHFGGDHDIKKRAPKFIKLMADEVRGKHAYADNGYFFDAVDHESKLREALIGVLKGNPVAGERLMYGSDWQMIIMENYWGDYLQACRHMIQKIESALRQPDSVEWKGFEQNFFGANAARYLGLEPPSDDRPNNLSRLCDFYRRNQVPEPAWMTKLGRTAKA